MFTCSQDSIANELDYIELGVYCADICRTLDRGMNGKQLSGLSQPVLEAIGQLTTYVEPAMHMLGGQLTKSLTTGRSQRFEVRSFKRTTEVESFDSSVRRMIRSPSLLGS